MDFIGHIYRRKVMKDPVRTMRIDGVKTTVTPSPDDSETAAHALLESRIYGDKEQRRQIKKAKAREGTPEYYRELSDKVREGRAAEARSAMRFVAYVEESLRLRQGDIAELEQGLYKFQDIAEREGGDLLRRWRHCLAECIIRLNSTDTGKPEDGHGPTDGSDNKDTKG